MKIITNPAEEIWADLLKRPAQDFESLQKIVTPILEEVKKNGDAAIKKYSAKFDGVDLNDFKVSEKELNRAEDLVDPNLKSKIQTAFTNIKKFHAAQNFEPQKVETIPEVICWWEYKAINSVGLYIPGGSAPLFSTVLMLGIPALLANCPNKLLCTPCQKDGTVHPAILYSARICGINQIYKIGGAQAIAAMAYGTYSVPKVDKIFGPGNAYVTVAKQLVQMQGVAIDMPAGPSEIAVIADKSANPAFIAADVLAQAEHGADSQVVVFTDQKSLGEKLVKSVNKQKQQFSRHNLIDPVIKNSKVFVFDTLSKAIAMANFFAAEHLSIMIENPDLALDTINNAGSVFIGDFTPVAAGDYASGTNHTLPTSGFARSYSGVSVNCFFKRITYQQISEQGIKNIGPTIETLAAAETLEAHKESVSIRLDYLKEKE